MDETLTSNSIKKRLSLQNEILKRISEISSKLEERANDVTVELHSLLDQAGAVELDLKNTFNSFRSLSYTHDTDHASTTPNGYISMFKSAFSLYCGLSRISDEGDDAYCMKREEDPVKVGIPAQDYEKDILPRYKEALSLSLISCKKHFEKKGQSRRSFLSAGSTYGPLPYIIGSEEYIHDNTCGLREEFEFGTSSHDFSQMMEPTAASSGPEGHDPPDLFGSHMFGMHQNPPSKDENEPSVSAVLDFKAMLEAALLNTYKFYDEESSSGYDVAGDSTGGAQKNVSQESSTSSQAATVGGSRHLNVEEQMPPVTAATSTNLTSPQDADVHDHKLYSSLFSGSLFDTEEAYTQDSIAGGPSASLSANEEEHGQTASSENIDSLVKDLESLPLFPDKLNMSHHAGDIAEEPEASYQSVTETSGGGKRSVTETAVGEQADSL